MSLSPEQIALLKKQLLRKGAELNQRLTDLLAQQQAGYLDLLHGKSKEQKRIDQLRHFLSLVDASIQAIRKGTYGTCQSCGAALPFEHLSQIPWIDTCQKCYIPPGEASM